MPALKNNTTAVNTISTVPYKKRVTRSMTQHSSSCNEKTYQQKKLKQAKERDTRYKNRAK